MKKQQHFNKPQLRSMMMAAPTEIFVAGRATGKTVGVLAHKTANKYVKSLPRSTGVLLHATFTQAFTRTIKELVRGWQMLGYQHEKHFLVGQKPPEKWKKMWNWQGPYSPPFEYKYFISWYNGAVCQIVSQERVGSSNGLSIDWFAGDEARLLDHERLTTELMPANRGIIPAFANNPYHHGYTLITDMPVGSAGRWILDMASKMDRQKVNDIWALLVFRYQVKRILEVGNAKAKAEAKKQLGVIDDELNDLRKGLLYYHEASTLDNIHALGIEYIKEQMRDTDQLKFDTQILNIRPMRLEDGFYPDLDEDVHGYFSENSSYFDNSTIDIFNPGLDCRKDADVDTNAPLHIAMDYNRRIHPIVVGQAYPDELRILKGIHALYPGKLKEAVTEFCVYYKPHKRKVVYYWYDHTAVGDQNETRPCDDVIAILRKHGWVVKGMYIGMQPGHEERYRMWGDLLTESGKYSRKCRINRENCDKLILSMAQAPAERRKNGFGKDKKTEHDNKFPAEESTHYSDAMDTLAFGILESKMTFGNEAKAGNGIMFG